MRRRTGPASSALILLLLGPLSVLLWLGPWVSSSPAYARGQATQITTATTTPGSSTPATTVPHTATTTRTTATTRPAATTVPVTTPRTTLAPVVPVAPTAPRVVPTTVVVTTTTVPATTTTIAGIRGKVPVAPLTIPLHTTGSNGHVDPLFAWLSGIGFAIVLLIVAGRLFVTRPGGRDRAPIG